MGGGKRKSGPGTAGEKQDAGGELRVLETPEEVQELVSGKRVLHVKGFGAGLGSPPEGQGVAQQQRQDEAAAQAISRFRPDFLVVDGDPWKDGFQRYVKAYADRRAGAGLAVPELVWVKNVQGSAPGPEERAKRLGQAREWADQGLPVVVSWLPEASICEGVDRLFGAGCWEKLEELKHSVRGALKLLELAEEERPDWLRGLSGTAPGRELYRAIEELEGRSEQPYFEKCSFENAAKGNAIYQHLRGEGRTPAAHGAVSFGGGESVLLEFATLYLFPGSGFDADQAALFPFGRGRPSDPRLPRHEGEAFRSRGEAPEPEEVQERQPQPQPQPQQPQPQPQHPRPERQEQPERQSRQGPRPPRHGWARWFSVGALAYGLVNVFFFDTARAFFFRHVGGKLLRLPYLDKGTMLEPKTTWPRPCSTRESILAESTTTGVKVILASVGQTGTTSLLQALRDLGYRSYDIEEKLLFAPELVYDTPTSLSLAKAASRCRVEAVAIEPTTDAFHLLLKASPEAKVILTWRAFEKWKRSAKASWEGVDRPWRLFYRQLAKSLKIFPWLQVWERLTGQVTAILRAGDPFTGRGQATVLSYVLNRNSGLSYEDSRANLLTRGPFKIAMGEEEYLAHMDEIRRVTPPGRLLEFEVGRHGFAELEEFLGLPPRLGGAPFPHVRSNRSWTNDAIQIQQPVVGRTALVLLLALHAFHCLAVGALLRCGHACGRGLWDWLGGFD